ncbi:hypothetical protein [Streptomyces sp. CO7]
MSSLRTALAAARVRRTAADLVRVSYSERTGEVCTRSCRAEAARERARTLALRFH